MLQESIDDKSGNGPCRWQSKVLSRKPKSVASTYFPKIKIPGANQPNVPSLQVLSNFLLLMRIKGKRLVENVYILTYSSIAQFL